VRGPVMRGLKRCRLLATTFLLAVPFQAGISGIGWSSERKVFDWSMPRPEQISPNPTDARPGGRPYLRQFGPSANPVDIVVEEYTGDDADINGAAIDFSGSGGDGTGGQGGTEGADHAG